MIPTTTTRPRPDKTVRYWEGVIGNRDKIARVLFLSRRQVDNYTITGIPDRHVFFLRLYAGELTLADWEDAVEGQNG